MKTMLLLLTMALTGLTTHAQQSLVQMASEAKVNWLLGDWVYYTSAGGGEITYSFSTVLDGHAVRFEHSGPDTKYPQTRISALIAYDPESGEVKHFGVDGQGAFESGVWTTEGGMAILKARAVRTDGEAGPFTIRFTKVDDNTMRTEIPFHPAEGFDGQIIQMEFKRRT